MCKMKGVCVGGWGFFCLFLFYILIQSVSSHQPYSRCRMQLLLSLTNHKSTT